jgi:hypothetical protein
MSGLTTLCAVLALGASPAPLDTGTLLFLEHSNPIIAQWTRSDVTHVAVIVREDSDTWIYEATPGHVRRIVLDEYLDELARMNQNRRQPIRAWAMSPRQAWPEVEQQAFTAYLDSQLGRRYSVRNYVRGKEGDGVHCGELASSALEHTGRFQLQPHYAQDPGRLVAALARQYHQPVLLALPEPSEEVPWCQRAWRSWTSLSNWCRWSCYETWTFCW